MLLSAVLLTMSFGFSGLPAALTLLPEVIWTKTTNPFNDGIWPPTVQVSWPVAGFVHKLPEIPYPNWNSGHRGIDISMPYGPNVYSPVSGVVSWVGTIDNQSGITIQADNDRLKHSLFPISSLLAEGDVVIRGQLIGEVTDDVSEHCGFTRCVHWGVRDGDRYLDPRWLLAPLLYELP